MSSSETFSISNEKLKCELCPEGATMVNLSLLEAGKPVRRLVLPPDQTARPFDPSYAGATLGPGCGRLRDGAITIEGRTYSIAPNEGRHCLHGGVSGLSHRLFSGPRIQTLRDRQSAEFTACLPDGLEGWPGNRYFSVKYTVGPGCRMEISYDAWADAPAYIDCSSHIYWDLRADASHSVLDHRLQIRADRVVYNDSEHLPVRMQALADTPFDFRHNKKISAQLKQWEGDPQLKNGRGYNNLFFLEQGSYPAVELESPEGDLRMCMFTDQPCLVFYSGGFLSNGTGNNGAEVFSSRGLAFEPQGYPADPAVFPGPVRTVYPGEHFHRFIAFELSLLC